MPRIPSEAEEDALAEADDDRAETYEDLEASKAPPAAAVVPSAIEPKRRVVQHDDRAIGNAPGTRAYSVESNRPVVTVDDLSPSAREALKKAREYQMAERKRQIEEDERYEKGGVEEPPVTPAEAVVAAAGASATAPAVAVVPAAAPVQPAPAAIAPVEAPAQPDIPKLDERIVKAWEAFNADRSAFETEKKQWQETVGTQQSKLTAIVEKFDWDPAGALRDLAAMRLNTDDDAKLRPVLDEVYDDLTGQRLGIEANDGLKAKREARRSRAELERYQRDQRVEAAKGKQETEAERTRAAAERDSQQISTWLSGTSKDSYAWLRTNDNAPALVRDVQEEFKKHGQTITVDQAAAFADQQLKEFAQAHFTRFKHLLAPDQAPAAPAAAASNPGAVPAQAPNQPATPPPANSQRTRTLTNTATATTPTKPPPPAKNFDPNEDQEEARMRSLTRWSAKRKAQQQ